MPHPFHRRDFLRALGTSLAGAILPGCGGDDDPGRYTEADIELLAQQRVREAERSGRGRFGVQRYRGYRGLAELPWFELDRHGALRCADEAVPRAIDMHSHLGISLLFAPEIDLHARTPRVEHLLDCDGSEPGCELDLDVYVNANFRGPMHDELIWKTVAQGTWGSAAATTHTIPNLLAEMDAMRVEQALLLPIAFNLPFGDDLTERWLAAIDRAGAQARLRRAASVHVEDAGCVAKLERYAADGARIVKLHPTMQRFYPDSDAAMTVYAACERLGLAVFFHGGRAGIEPEATQRYAMPRHYEGAFSSFPRVPFVIGHAGARDGEAMLELALRYENAWLGIHGQSLTRLDESVRRSGGERLLFGSDWPFYHLGVQLAKVLLVTEGDAEMRHRLLRGNAERLIGPAPA